MQKRNPSYKEPNLSVIFYGGLVALSIAFIAFPAAQPADKLTVPEIHHFVAPPLPVKDTYTAEFGDHSHIYDGDTWIDMYITVKTLEKTDYPAEVLWPGIFLAEDTLYVVTDIRLKGIDTPENHPATAGRTQESLAKEKAAAEQAKAAAEALLASNNYEFIVTEPQMGKYAGRTVANILIGEERINLADYLIEKGLGYRYGGGHKIPFDEWYPAEASQDD